MLAIVLARFCEHPQTKARSDKNEHPRDTRMTHRKRGSSVPAPKKSTPRNADLYTVRVANLTPTRALALEVALEKPSR